MHAVAQIYGTKKELTDLQLLLRLCYPHKHSHAPVEGVRMHAVAQKDGTKKLTAITYLLTYLRFFYML